MGGKLTTTGLTVGAYYMSAVTAGLLTQTAPTAAGQFRQPVMIAVSTTEAYVLGFELQKTALSDVLADLSDYETGTWTPQLDGSTTGTATYTIQVGTYTKIGDVVHIQGRMVISALGTIAGTARLKGLPFTSEATTDNYSSVDISYSAGMVMTAGGSLGATLAGNAVVANIRIWDAAIGSSLFLVSEYTANGDIIFSAQYKAA